jgi:hypothetical protein
MRLFVLTVIAAGLHAQTAVDPSQPQILVQGVAVDKDSHSPVAGAEVSVSFTSFPSATPASPRVSNGSAVSGSGGDFQIRLNQGENLNVSVQAPHYQVGRASLRGITPDQSSVFVEVPMIHLQSLGGMLVDDETRKPIGGLTVELLAPRPDLIGATNILVQGMKAISGTDGGFSFPDVPRGEYFLRIADKPEPAIGEIPAKELAGDGRDKALEPPEGALSYGTVIWPGRNADIPIGPGIAVGATPVDAGEIRLTRSKLQNLSGLVAPCEEGASIPINLSRPSADSARGLLATRDITCGDGFQLLNLPEGSFTATAIQGFPQRRWASQAVDAHTRNPLRLTLAAFVAVQISVEVEGAPPDAMPPAVRFTFEPENKAVKVDAPAMLASGVFEATLYPGERFGITLQGGPKYYLKRLVYDGSSLPDVSGLTASAAPLSQLRVVLSNAATIAVHLTEGGNPSKNRIPMALLRDGMGFAEFRKQLFRALDPSGAMTFGGLAPGTYRAIRTDPDQPLPTTEALFQAMLADASRQSMSVTVDEGQTATITWDLP